MMKSNASAYLTADGRDYVTRFSSVYDLPQNSLCHPRERILEAIEQIKSELQVRRQYLLDNNKLLEEQRISQRTQFDIEMMNELGFCSGSKTTHVT